ncbi:hypothetical protein [Streptomyces sp. NPDC054838]
MAESASRKARRLDFTVPPGGLLPAEGSVKGPPVKVKTVKVPDALNRHIMNFMARHPVDFANVALALWRALMREEIAELEAAKVAQRREGGPVAPKTGPIYQAMAAELQMMRDEQSGRTSDQ